MMHQIPPKMLIPFVKDFYRAGIGRGGVQMKRPMKSWPKAIDRYFGADTRLPQLGGLQCGGSFEGARKDRPGAESSPSPLRKIWREWEHEMSRGKGVETEGGNEDVAQPRPQLLREAGFDWGCGGLRGDRGCERTRNQARGR